MERIVQRVLLILSPKSKPKLIADFGGQLELEQSMIRKSLEKNFRYIFKHK